jgi:hypothetical protein
LLIDVARRPSRGRRRTFGCVAPPSARKGAADLVARLVREGAGACSHEVDRAEARTVGPQWLGVRELQCDAGRVEELREERGIGRLDRPEQRPGVEQEHVPAVARGLPSGSP